MRAVANPAEERKGAEWTKEEYLAHLAKEQRRVDAETMLGETRKRSGLGDFLEPDNRTPWIRVVKALFNPFALLPVGLILLALWW